MNLALTINCWSDEDLLFASQFGVTHILAEATMPQRRHWDTPVWAPIRNRVEKANLTLVGLADLPQQYGISEYLAQAQSNDPKADEGLNAVCGFIAEVGAAGIPLVVCNCDLPGTGESVKAPEGRGGALIHKYEHPVPASPESIAAGWQQPVPGCTPRRVV